MQAPRIEVPVGVIDGVNVTFTLSAAYATGQLNVFVNGVLQRRDFVDGWVETSPASGVFVLKEAPRLGDTVQAYYLPADGSVGGVAEVVCDLDGTLEPVVTLSARMHPVRAVRAVLRCGCY